MPESGAVKVLVVPVFKRYWLFHAWRTAAAAASAPPKPWQQGSSLTEQLQLLLAAIQRWGSKQGEQQWQKIVTAPEGTFNHKLHRYVVFPALRPPLLDAVAPCMRACMHRASCRSLVAPPGLAASLGVLFSRRLAQEVLSRVDPNESFLKVLLPPQVWICVCGCALVCV